MRYFIFLPFVLIACKGASVVSSNTQQDNEALKIDSIHLEIMALDLTEDMSPISSKNDEIVVFVYGQNNSSEQISLLLSGAFTMTKENNSRSLASETRIDVTPHSIMVVMLERDTEHNLTQLDEMVRASFNDLVKSYQLNGNFGIEKFIDDNDIIGIKTLHLVNKVTDFDFKGIFKLDKYHYKLVLSIP